jgi:hypothetical protein
MNKFRFAMKMATIAIFMFAFASLAQAQATRTWVSGVGDDVNPCSRTAPCKTFAGAISKTADGGEIDCLDPGGFGVVTITKGITIDGTTGGGFGSILAAGTNGVIVNETTNTKYIALRNLSINGATTGFDGVRFLAGKHLHVEGCTIAGFKGNGLNSDGIEVALTTNSSQQLTVLDTIIRENSGDGIRLGNTAGTVNVYLDNVRSERNIGVGLRAGSTAVAQVRNCVFSFNTAANLRVENAGSSANIENSFFQGSPADGIIATAGNVRLRGSHITNNGVSGVNCAGGTISSFQDNAISGNATNIVGCTDPLPLLQKK